MARAYKRIDKSTDRTLDNGDRVRTYNVHNGADDSVIGYCDEHWHAAMFADGVVNMTAYQNSIADGRRTVVARTLTDTIGENIAPTLANHVAAVRKNVLGK